MKIEDTDKILRTLEYHGFKVLSFGTGFRNPFEVIDEEYFNEKVTEALE